MGGRSLHDSQINSPLSRLEQSQLYVSINLLRFNNYNYKFWVSNISIISCQEQENIDFLWEIAICLETQMIMRRKKQRKSSGTGWWTFPTTTTLSWWPTLSSSPACTTTTRWRFLLEPKWTQGLFFELHVCSYTCSWYSIDVSLQVFLSW